MINNFALTKIASNYFFYRWHPEVALRYLPIVDEINKLGKESKVAEIGSGSFGIAPYLGRIIIGVDLRFTEPYYPLVDRIEASSINLPFKSNSFDTVICVDMLEHLNSKKRKIAISEMIRIAKQKIIIAVPCGKKAYSQDLILDKQYKKKFGRRYQFLVEQINYGLPVADDITETIKLAANNLNKIVVIKVVGNENLSLRYFLMKGWISRNFLLDLFFRRLLLLALPVMRKMNKEPTYRKIFYVNIK